VRTIGDYARAHRIVELQAPRRPFPMSWWRVGSATTFGRRSGGWLGTYDRSLRKQDWRGLQGRHVPSWAAASIRSTCCRRCGRRSRCSTLSYLVSGFRGSSSAPPMSASASAWAWPSCLLCLGGVVWIFRTGYKLKAW